MLLSSSPHMAETVLAYNCYADELVVTVRELATWFDCLFASEHLRMHTLGQRHYLLLPAFRQYVLEQHDYAMPAHLTSDELALWIDQSDEEL